MLDTSNHEIAIIIAGMLRALNKEVLDWDQRKLLVGVTARRVNWNEAEAWNPLLTHRIRTQKFHLVGDCARRKGFEDGGAIDPSLIGLQQLSAWSV